MRLFLAVTPEARALRDIVEAAARLRRGLEADDVLRWVEIARQHLTLHFLGDIEPVSADRLIARLDAPVRHASFEMELGDFGIFPPAGMPRVIWMGVRRGGAELTRLHGELASRLREAGLAIEPRAFAPHLTLARVRGDRDRARHVRQRLAAMPAHAGIASRVDRVTLFESDLSAARPRYRAVLDLELQNG